MEYKGALLKGMKKIPSHSLRLKYCRQPKPKINLRPAEDNYDIWPDLSVLKKIPSLSLKSSHTQPNWLDLPPDLMVLIMQRIDWYDVLMNVKEVCKYWYELSKDPSIWRVIEFRADIMVKKLRKKMGILTYEQLLDKYFRELTLSESPVDMPCRRDYKEIENNFQKNVNKALQKMVMHVIDLSCGQLRDLCFHNFGSDDLFKYIYQRSSQLKRLRLESCMIWCFNYEIAQHDRHISQKGLIQMLKNLPSLVELQLSYTRIFGKGIEIIGHCCPHLKSFTLNRRVYACSRTPTCDKQALAIAKSMPGLRHLQLFGNRMTITGLMAILNNCHHIEYLDLRQCYGLCDTLKDEPNVKTKLHQQIKHVKFPKDSTEDYEVDDSIYDYDGHIGSDSSSYLTDDEK